MVPDEYLGGVLKLCQDRRGRQKELTYAGSRAMLRRLLQYDILARYRHRGKTIFTALILLPIVLLAAAMQGAGINAGRWAVVSAFAGIALERWLFFAEARHLVTLFYGRTV